MTTEPKQQSDSEKAAAAIRELLAGFTPLDPKALPTFKNVESWLHDPPAYVLRLLLLRFMGFPNLGPDEKVHWQTAFRFKDQDFLIRDFKFETWTIEAAKPVEAAHVGELKGRLRAAAKKLDAVLADELRADVKAERYALVNTFYRLNKLYDDYRARTEESVKAFDALKDAKDEDGKLFSVHNKRIAAETRAAHDAFGLVGAFFSLLEFLAAGMHALHRTGGTYADFQKKKLHERLLDLLPTISDKDWARVYNRIIQLRDNYRNPLHHGLTSDELGVLVAVRGLGLIPLSYRYLADGLHFGTSLGVSIDEVRQVLATCAEALDALRTRDPYHYYFAFIEGGFPIPVDLGEAAKERKLMTSHEEFAEYVAGRQRYEDDVINRDV